MFLRNADSCKLKCHSLHKVNHTTRTAAKCGCVYWLAVNIINIILTSAAN